MSKIFTSKIDRCFKCIHLNPLNKDLLLLQINGITRLGLKNISYSNVERNSNNIYVKRKTMDSLFDTDLYSINIEVNARNLDYINVRNMSYNCDAYSNSTKVSKIYNERKQFIQINYSYGIKSNKPINVYMMRDEDNNLYVKNFIIYEINMDYIMDYWYNRNKQQVNIEMAKKYKYIIMLNLNYDDLNELIEITKDERIVKYMEELKKVNCDPKYRQYLTKEEDDLFIRNSLIEEGEKRGIKVGEKRGIKVGEKRGIEIQKEKTLKGMLIENIPLESISRILKMPLEQIRQYQQQLIKG